MPSPTPQDHPSRGVDDALEGFAFDAFVVDTGARRLLRNDDVVPLPSRVFDVLVLLIEQRDRSVQKDEIISTIWDNVVVTDDSLIHAISVLRRALDDDPQHPRYIETIPRRGYRFIASVRSVQAEAGARPKLREPTVEPQATDEVGTPAPLPRAAATRVIGPWPAAFASAAAVAAVALVLAFVYIPRGEAPLVESGFDASINLYQTAPAGTTLVSSGVLSPDSNYLAFVAREDSSGSSGLWIRSLQGGALRRIANSDGAAMPFWSPDSNRIGFFAHGKLMVSDLYGDAMREIASVSGAAGASWANDDTVLFAEWAKGLFTTSARGDGEVRPVLTLEREARDIAFAWPQFFGDSQRFLFQIVSLDPERAGAWVGNLESPQNFKLLDTQSAATFAPPAHLLYQHKDMLIAEQLDPQRLELSGDAVVIARGVAAPRLATQHFVSASNDLLVFREGAVQQHLAWFSRSGEPLEVLAVPTTLFNPRLSHDGTSLLASSSVTDDPGLWLVTLDNGHVTRIDVDAIAPVWSPGDRHIAYTSRDGGDILLRSLEGQAGPTLLASDDSVKIMGDWTPDGSTLIYTRQSLDSSLDLWAIDVATAVSRPLLESEANETQARISPDGQWIAWASDASGTVETWVARYPGFEERRQVSLSGGGQPHWRQDQRELFFLAADKQVMGVEIDTAGALETGTPYPLFRAAIAGDPGDAREYFTVDAAGARFLVDSTLDDDAEGRLTVMVNWAARTRDAADSAQAGTR